VSVIAAFIYDYHFAGAGKVMERLDNRAEGAFIIILRAQSDGSFSHD
jgi:hypothetical protein